MKKLIFITLKILEVLAIVAIYLGLAKFGYWIEWILYKNNFFVCWYHPFNILPTIMVLVVIAVIVFLIYLLIESFPKWIESNKQLTDKIYKKLKK